MWVLGKIKESMESIPLELSRHMGKSEEDMFLSSNAKVPHFLHSHIITPDNIPEFCLPPRLCKRRGNSPSNITHARTKDETKTDIGDTYVVWKATKKPLPFSAEGYGLTGIYESPNTRRKESLFHSECPIYSFDRTVPIVAPNLAKETNLPKKTFLPLFLRKHLSETGSTESETPSSSDSSPLSSPYSARPSVYIPTGSGPLKGSTSCPLLTDTREDRWSRKKRGVLSLTTSPRSTPSLEGSSLTLAPPVLFPLDVLQCQERLWPEHVLPLQSKGGKVRLSAEHSTFSTNTFSSLFTVRVRVVSVEGLWDENTESRTQNCAVNLCLTPDKLQRQESANIKNCQSTAVFNEDFYFTGLCREDLLEQQLRIKVVDRPTAGTLRRGTVIGVITIPLSKLLLLKNE